MFSKKDIENYFIAEKRESRLFMIMGIGGVFLALDFVFLFKAPLYKGMALPMAALGIILAIVGITVYNRSDRQRLDNMYAYDNNPLQLKNEELPRMRKVMKSFVLYRWIEIIFILIGAGLYIYFIRDFHHDFWRGFGFGLAFMAVLALPADYFAEKRGHLYTRGLESFSSNLK